MPTDDPAQETEPFWNEPLPPSPIDKWTWALALGLAGVAVGVALLMGHWKGF